MGGVMDGHGHAAHVVEGDDAVSDDAAGEVQPHDAIQRYVAQVVVRWTTLGIVLDVHYAQYQTPTRWPALPTPCASQWVVMVSPQQPKAKRRKQKG